MSAIVGWGGGDGARVRGGPNCHHVWCARPFFPAAAAVVPRFALLAPCTLAQTALTHNTHKPKHTPKQPSSWNAGSVNNPAGLIAYVADVATSATLLVTNGCWTYAVTSVPGTSAAKPAAKASDIYAYSASDDKPASGAFWYLPPGAGTTSPVQLFTDFSMDGGGWVVVSKWGGYSKTLDKLFNANAYDNGGGNSLADGNFAGYSTYARLSRTFVNALWGSCGRYVARVHFKNDDYPSTSGVFFQQKVRVFVFVCVFVCFRLFVCGICCACVLFGLL